MSNPGERDDAPIEDFEDVADEIEQGGDEPGADEGGEDAGDADDAGGTADHLSDDHAGTDEGQGGQPAQVKQIGRRERAVLEAKRIAREAKAEAEATKAELARLQQEHQGRSLAEQQAEERARLELMGPDEKTDYLLNKQRQEFSGALNQLRFEQADSRDATRFEAVCARTPAFAGIQDQVEKELAQMRRNGANAPRETIAIYLLGKKALERAGKGGAARQAARGKERVQQERVAAPSGRSDVRGGAERRGGNDAAARKARLGDIQI